MGNTIGRIGPFFMAQNDDGAPPEATNAALDRLVIGKGAVPGQRDVIINYSIDIVPEMRTVRVTGDLNLLPGGQLLIALPQQLIGLGLQARHFIGDIDFAIIRQMAQLFNFAF